MSPSADAHTTHTHRCHCPRATGVVDAVLLGPDENAGPVLYVVGAVSRRRLTMWRRGAGGPRLTLRSLPSLLKQ